MSHQTTTRGFIEGALQDARFAVLATEGNGQPHASLIAVTPVEGFRQLIFATYRNTRKFRNMADNGKVAVLIDGRASGSSGLQEDLVLTVLGYAEEIGAEDRESAFSAHLARHPDLESFLRSPDCAIVSIAVSEYQVVLGINDVRWCSVDDLVFT